MCTIRKMVSSHGRTKRRRNDFDNQGSSDEDDARLGKQEDESESEDEVALSYESEPRCWKLTGQKRSDEKVAAILLHADDLSSDKDDAGGRMNCIAASGYI